jgi:hypothetical protein
MECQHEGGRIGGLLVGCGFGRSSAVPAGVAHQYQLQVGRRRAFASVATASSLDTPARQDFVGPLGARIRELVVSADSVTVGAKLPPWFLGFHRELRVKPPGITRRQPLTETSARALRLRGCPVDAPWNQQS